MTCAEDIQLVFDIYFEGITQNDTAWKVSKYGGFSGPYSP